MQPILSFKNRFYLKPDVKYQRLKVFFLIIYFLPLLVIGIYTLVYNDLFNLLIAYYLVMFAIIFFWRYRDNRYKQKTKLDNDFIFEIYTDHILQKWILKNKNKDQSEAKNYFTTLKQIKLDTNRIEFIYPEGKLICETKESLTNDEIHKLTSNKIIGKKIQLSENLLIEP